MNNIVEYDLVFWIKQNSDESMIQQIFEDIQNKLQNKGFVIISSLAPEKKLLANNINKEKEAYLASIAFGIGEGDIENIKDIFAFNDNILRFLITKKEMRPEKPKIKRSRSGYKSKFAFRDDNFNKEKISEDNNVEYVAQEQQIKNGSAEQNSCEPKIEQEIDLNELDKKLDELLN